MGLGRSMVWPAARTESARRSGPLGLPSGSAWRATMGAVPSLRSCGVGVAGLSAASRRLVGVSAVVQPGAMVTMARVQRSRPWRSSAPMPPNTTRRSAGQAPCQGTTARPPGGMLLVRRSSPQPSASEGEMKMPSMALGAWLMMTASWV